MAFATARAFGISNSLIDRAVQIQLDCDRKLEILKLGGGCELKRKVIGGKSEQEKTVARSCSTDGGLREKERRNRYTASALEELLLNAVVRSENLKGLLLSPFIRELRGDDHAPPSMEGKSVVYMLIKRMLPHEGKEASCARGENASRTICHNCSCAVSASIRKINLEKHGKIYVVRVPGGVCWRDGLSL